MYVTGHVSPSKQQWPGSARAVTHFRSPFFIVTSWIKQRYYSTALALVVVVVDLLLLLLPFKLRAGPPWA